MKIVLDNLDKHYVTELRCVFLLRAYSINQLLIVCRDV